MCSYLRVFLHFYYCDVDVAAIPFVQDEAIKVDIKKIEYMKSYVTNLPWISLMLREF